MHQSKPLEEYFADWESHVFGFGYGTGEVPVLTALQQFMGKCDKSQGGRYDYAEIQGLVGPAVTWLLINVLCKAFIIEYGTSPRFGWLTSAGLALRKFILAKSVDELSDALDGEHDLDDPQDTTANPFYRTYVQVKDGK